MAGAARTEEAGGRPWRLDPDALPPPGDRLRAVLRARVVDETTGEPVRQALHLAGGRPGLWPHAGSDGLVGLVGRPAQALSTLGGSAVPLALRIESAGFVPVTLAGSLGPLPGFPATAFAPLDLGDVALHRLGVALEGRVMHRVPAPVPLAGASVRLDALWPVLPPPGWTPPALAEPPRLLALEPGLYAPRSVGTVLRQRPLVPHAALQRLLAPADAGARQLLLSDHQGLAAGSELLLDRDDHTRVEVLRIAALDATAADLPCRVTLAHPCARAHRDGVACVGVTPQPPAATAALARAAIAGDRVGFTAALPALADGAFVEIDDGVQPPEWQRVGRYETTADARGFFRLPPLARVALVRLRVHAGALTDTQPIVTLDYRQAVQRLDVSLE